MQYRRVCVCGWVFMSVWLCGSLKTRMNDDYNDSVVSRSGTVSFFIFTLVPSVLLVCAACLVC